jgi:hypothetical protein
MVRLSRVPAAAGTPPQVDDVRTTTARIAIGVRAFRLLIRPSQLEGRL